MHLPIFIFVSTLLIGSALLSYNVNNIANDKFKKNFFSDEKYRKLYHYELKLKKDLLSIFYSFTFSTYFSIK